MDMNIDRPLIEILRSREGSEVVGAFIDWLKEMDEIQKSSWEVVLEEDDKIQDFLHEFEFEPNNKKRAVIGTRLHNSRVRRRKAKDVSKKLKPVSDFMREISTRNLTRLLNKMRGDLKAAEDFVNGKREYKPRAKVELHRKNNKGIQG